MADGDSPQDDPAKAGFFKKFAGDLGNSIRMGVVGWISAAILAVLFGWITLFGGKFADLWRDRETVTANIPVDDAFRIARKSINSTVLWVVPFRNRGDDTQYIAAWVRSNEPRCSEALSEVEAERCYNERGWARVYLMEGRDGVYESRQTPLKALEQYLQHDTVKPEDMDRAEFRRDRLPYFGITDWNDDGKKEILSVSQTTGTQPTHHYVTGVFDVATKKLATLDVAQSETSENLNFSGSASPQLKKWLGQRHREFFKALRALNKGTSVDCNRSLKGVLACTTGSGGHNNGIDAVDAEMNDIETRLIEKWTEANGLGFTSGKIALAFEAGPALDAYGPPCASMGKWTLVNLFKGPLLIIDENTRAASVLYQQDGEHHREIPIIIVGRQYVWLGLSTGHGVIAIDRSNFTAVEAWVYEWNDGIPDIDPYAEPNSMLRLDGRKDLQLDEIRLVGGQLFYGGDKLDVRIDGKMIDQASEFGNARGCTSGGATF
jgi:hypothetical protein